MTDPVPTQAEELAAAALWRRLPLGDPGGAKSVLARALAEHRAELLFVGAYERPQPPEDPPIERVARLLYAWNCELADELRGPHGHNTWSGTSRAHQARYIERAVRLRDVLQPAQPPVEPTVAPSALETLAQAVLDGRVALWTSAPDGRTQTKTDIQVDPPRGATS